MPLNDEQLKAYKANGQNMTVSASAGTGKTFLVVQRLVRLIIEENISIDKLLVMSFTDLAAQELRERLAKILKENIDNYPDKKDYILQQIALIPSSLVCTMHSFCLDVIKNYSYVLTIDPLLVGNVATDSQIENFKQSAMEKTLSNLTNYNGLVSMLCNRVEDLQPLTSSIIAISKVLENQANENDYINKVNDIYENLANDKLVKPLEKCYQLMLNTKIDSIFVVLDQVKYYYSIASSGYDDFLKLYLEIENNLNNFKVEQKQQYLDSLTFKFPTRKKGEDETENDTKNFNSIKRKYNDYVAQLNDIYKARNSIKEYGINSIKYVKQLIELTVNYQNNYQQIKTDNHYIDYADMENFAFDILKKNNGEIAKQLRDKFAEIIVDEYQDTNEKQEALIQLICKNNNVFRVGDIKQSIYGFRGSKPEIMKQLISSADEKEVVHLVKNFRCDQSVINYTNEVFSHLMNVSDQDSFSNNDKIDYGNEVQLENNIPVSFYRIVNEEDDAKSLKKKICSFIADKIEQLHQENNISYNQITILVRNNKNKYLIKDYLTNKNIPCFCSFDGGFYNDEAVNSCLSLLNLIVNDEDQMSLIDVLAGPIFKYSYDEIAQYHLDKENKTLFDYLSSINHPVTLLIKQLRDTYTKQGIVDVLDQIYDYQDFYYTNTSINQRSNLDELYQLIVSFASKDGSLVNLLNYFKIEQQQQAKQDAMYISKADDVVSLMTIHQSKGLENDNVIITDFNISKNNRSPLKVDSNLGFSLDTVQMPQRIRYPNLYKQLIDFNEQYNELQEENRILYVALTRAKKRLILISADNELNNKDFNYENIKSASCYSDRLLITSNSYPYIKKYFQIEEISVDQKDVDIKYNNKKYNMVKYDKHIEEKKLETPSATHPRAIYQINFDYHGNVRGTLMHKAIELSGLTYDENKIAELKLELQDKEKIIAFYNNDFTKQIANYEHYHEMPYLDNGVNGIIDLLVISEEKIYIIDFKSDVNVTKEILKERYIDQLQAYKDVVIKIYPNKNIETLIYSFDLNEYVLVD